MSSIESYYFDFSDVYSANSFPNSCESCLWNITKNGIDYGKSKISKIGNTAEDIKHQMAELNAQIHQIQNSWRKQRQHYEPAC